MPQPIHSAAYAKPESLCRRYNLAKAHTRRRPVDSGLSLFRPLYSPRPLPAFVTVSKT